MVEVAAALIRRGNRFMICQRPENKKRGLLWEFVGGKAEPGEALAETLVRECREELGVTVRADSVFTEVTHEYPDISIRLTLFNAEITGGEPQLLEHKALRWITPDEIPLYEFCPADKNILGLIREDQSFYGLPSGVKIRRATPSDYGECESLTREAFWNVYKPGCDEHYILHRFRSRPDFIGELEYVAEKDGSIVAHIMYCRAPYTTDGGRSVMTAMFGPVSVESSVRNSGIGSALIRYTLSRAEALGFGAVTITGSPDFYHRFGFVSSSSVGVFYAEAGREEEAPFFMVRELKRGFLPKEAGSFHEPDGYVSDKEGLEAFDKLFPPKKKEKRPGQLI